MLKLQNMFTNTSKSHSNRIKLEKPYAVGKRSKYSRIDGSQRTAT